MNSVNRLLVVALLGSASVATAQTTRPGRSWRESLRPGNSPQTVPAAAPVLPDFQAKAAGARATIQTIREQLELYALQHPGHYPEPAQLADWRLLTQRTNEKGELLKRGGEKALGPYLQAAPVNPFTGMTKLGVPEKVDGATGWVMRMDGRTPEILAVVPDLPTVRAVVDEKVGMFSNQVRLSAPTTLPASRGPISSATVKAALAMLQTVTAQNELYKFMHRNQPPRLSEVNEWQVFLVITNAEGRAPAAGERGVGPYLLEQPLNPITGKSNVVARGLASADAGWTYDEKMGRFFLVAPEGLDFPASAPVEIERYRN